MVFEVEKRGRTAGYVNTTLAPSDEGVKEERDRRLEWAKSNGYDVYYAREGNEYTYPGITEHYVAVRFLQDGLLEIVPLYSTNVSWVRDGNAFPPCYYSFYKMKKVRRKLRSDGDLKYFKLYGLYFFPYS